ncbi:hypothetical protein ACFVVA_28685 [Kitasatospora sp. NPDC058048]|uniref:hypothetical protein n=1 Tax=Kitasatospora sp. NPDC058048 TaxID=3346313 RepID=UPI0036D7F97E
MIVSLSITVLFAIIAILLVRARRSTLGAAVVVWLSGFTTAGTGLADPVNTFLAAVAHLFHR